MEISVEPEMYFHEDEENELLNQNEEENHEYSVENVSLNVIPRLWMETGAVSF